MLLEPDPFRQGSCIARCPSCYTSPEGKKTTLKEIRHTLAFNVERMATKDVLKSFATRDDVARLDVKIDKLELSLHRELEAIKQEIKNVSGFGKEINHALERIAAIDKHLGIEKKIAA